MWHHNQRLWLRPINYTCGWLNRWFFGLVDDEIQSSDWTEIIGFKLINWEWAKVQQSTFPHCLFPWSNAQDKHRQTCSTWLVLKQLLVYSLVDTGGSTPHPPCPLHRSQNHFFPIWKLFTWHYETQTIGFPRDKKFCYFS